MCVCAGVHACVCVEVLYWFGAVLCFTNHKTVLLIEYLILMIDCDCKW